MRGGIVRPIQSACGAGCGRAADLPGWPRRIVRQTFACAPIATPRPAPWSMPARHWARSGPRLRSCPVRPGDSVGCCRADHVGRGSRFRRARLAASVRTPPRRPSPDEDVAQASGAYATSAAGRRANSAPIRTSVRHSPAPTRRQWKRNLRASRNKGLCRERRQRGTGGASPRGIAQPVRNPRPDGVRASLSRAGDRRVFDLSTVSASSMRERLASRLISAKTARAGGRSRKSSLVPLSTRLCRKRSGARGSPCARDASATSLARWNLQVTAALPTLNAWARLASSSESVQAFDRQRQKVLGTGLGGSFSTR